MSLRRIRLSATLAALAAMAVALPAAAAAVAYAVVVPAAGAAPTPGRCPPKLSLSRSRSGRLRVPGRSPQAPTQAATALAEPGYPDAMRRVGLLVVVALLLWA